MANATSILGLNVIRSFEGRALRAYQDEVHVWTVGYGLTNYDADFVKRYGKIGAGFTLTAEQCEAELVRSLRVGYEPAVGKALPDQGQGVFDAGVSFHFNTGAISRASWPKAWMRNDHASARASLLSWNKAGGNVLSGLTRRRNREWSMAASNDYGPEGRSGPTSIGAGPTAGPLHELPPLAGMPPPAQGDRVPGTLVAKGDVGQDVKEFQAKLVLLGFTITDPPGTSGTSTDAAVRAFQAQHPNLTTDGLIGPATASAINRDLALRDKIKKGTAVVVATGSASGGAATIAHSAGVLSLAGLHHGLVVILVASVAVGVVYAGWQLWKYRDGVKRTFNKMTGKTVP